MACNLRYYCCNMGVELEVSIFNKKTTHSPKVETTKKILQIDI